MSDENLLLEAYGFKENLLNFFWRQGVEYAEGEDLVLLSVSGSISSRHLLCHWACSSTFACGASAFVS